MGLIKQLSRSLKNLIDNIFGFITRKKRKRRGPREKPIVVPRSWRKESKPEKATEKIIIKYKRKIPGLRKLNQILAGFLLIINFVFSQFLLGSIGAAAQPIFWLFIANSYCLALLLWKYRTKED